MQCLSPAKDVKLKGGVLSPINHNQLRKQWSWPFLLDLLDLPWSILKPFLWLDFSSLGNCPLLSHMDGVKINKIIVSFRNQKASTSPMQAWMHDASHIYVVLPQTVATALEALRCMSSYAIVLHCLFSGTKGSKPVNTAIGPLHNAMSMKTWSARTWMACTEPWP